MNATNITDSEIESYLLGDVEGDTAESIEELTITDEEFALRVDAIEQDLVDDYLSMELDADKLNRFESHYLRSEKRRDKVRASRLFGEFVASAVTPKEHPIRAEPEVTRWTDIWWKFAIPAFAAAILVAVAIPVWYVVTSEAPRIASENENIEQGPLANGSEVVRSNEPTIPSPQTTATIDADPSKDNSRPVLVPDRDASPPVPRIFAVTLFPQTRGSQGETTMSPPAKTDRVAVTLRLEPTDQKTVRIELRESSSDKIVWQTNARPSKISGGFQSVRLDLPARLISSGRYSFVVTVRSEGEEPEIVGDYPFRVIH